MTDELTPETLRQVARHVDGYERALALDCANAWEADRLEKLTLDQVSRLYSEGKISREQAEEYVKKWNAGPHFTQAVVGNGWIANRDVVEKG